MNNLTLPTELPVLQGKRLTLRAMTDDDAAVLFSIYGDPEVMRHTGEEPFPDLETVGVMLTSVRRLLAEGQSLEWAVVLQASGDVVGTCGLHDFRDGERAAQVGCMLKRPCWGHGTMSEALALVIRFAADGLRLGRLSADIAPDNERSRRLFLRLGFQRTSSDMLEIALR